jgi:hypothetical protein
MVQKGEDGVDPAADSDFCSIVQEVLRVKDLRLESTQQEVEELQKVYRFVRRDEPTQSDRED